MSTNVDLRQLAVRRDAPNGRPPTRRRKHLVARYVVPGAIVLGFLGVIGWSARDAFLSAQPVTVVPVLTSRVELQQEGTPLFQAAGWLEPRPTPVVVTALADGVVEQLLVVEGQEVRRGQTVAVLIKQDADLALAMAEAEKELKEAELKALGSTAEKELQNLGFQIQTAQAHVDQARREWESKRELHTKAIVSELEVRRAETAHATATSSLKELQGRKRVAEQEFQAQIEAAKARLRLAAVAVRTANLRLSRMTIQAPITGRVLALVTRPGARIAGAATSSLHDSSTAITMYDPMKLQVRADVRLEDVPRVQPGQKVRIETPAAPGGPLEGEVLFATSQADIQKNTLQVKLSLEAPPQTLRPDMLVQVTFLAPPPPKSVASGTPRLRLLVPKQLVQAGEGGTRVWLADQTAGVARLRAVKLGAAAGDLVEVIEGLNAGDRLVSGGREGLRDGQRILVTGEDAATWTAPRPPEKTPPKHNHGGRHGPN
jgi:HlyD family secretion protein